MSDEMIIQFCAPTLAAIKTGSLFRYSFADAEDLTESLRQVNRCLLIKGVRAIPLSCHKDRALIYLYRPTMLKLDLTDPLAADICGSSAILNTMSVRKLLI